MMRSDDDTRTPGAALPPRERLRGIVKACHARMGRPLGDDVEDVVQEVHVLAWRKLPTFRGETSIDSWIFGIARLSILRQLSREDRWRSREVPITEDGPEPEDGATRPGSRFDTEFRELLQRGLEGGAEGAAEIFRAHELEGQTFGAIGERLGLSETAVKSRYYRSVEALRTRLAPLWAALRR